MLKPTPQVPDFHLHDAHDPAAPAHHRAGMARRDWLQAGLVLTGSALATAALPGYAQAARRGMTPLQTIGPFYPADLPADMDADLTQVMGHTQSATGTVIYLTGKVMNTRGEPVVGAELDIWQANAGGRYAHPADTNKVPLDPHFQGFARIRTGADGSYSLKTIKPGAYPTGVGDWTRPPHIHFDVRGKFSRSITQMYFEGEALNAKDRLLQEAHDKAALISRYTPVSGKPEKGALGASWDIVLNAG